MISESTDMVFSCIGEILELCPCKSFSTRRCRSCRLLPLVLGIPYRSVRLRDDREPLLPSDSEPCEPKLPRLEPEDIDKVLIDMLKNGQVNTC
jgi:hypothetical protein